MLETYIADTQAVHGDLVKIYSDAAAGSIGRSGSRATGVSATVTGGNSLSFDLTSKRRSSSCRVHDRLLRAAAEERARRQREVGKRVAIHPSPALIAILTRR